jgi:hypothetical protein
MSIIGSIAHFFVEQQAGKTTLETLSHKMEDSAVVVAQRLFSAPDTTANREIANHIIGMERWGQRRLDSMFNNEKLTDEYDNYQPGPRYSLSELHKEFQATRALTLARLLKISQHPELERCAVTHNMLGPLSVKGWFYYLDTHASREVKKIKLN